MLSHKRLIVGAVVGVMLAAAGVTLLIPNQYTSRATILPSGHSDRMADLKNLAGLDALTLHDENSSQLYPDVLSSRSVRDAVLGRQYTFSFNGNAKTLNLTEYFNEDDPDRLRDELAGITSVAADKKTGVIRISVTTMFPELSQAILGRYLSELESFNLHQRRSAAKDKAEYLSRQVAASEIDLAAAEDSLSAFQSVNRDWETTADPEVYKGLARRKRKVEIAGQTYLFLTQEFEVAKLDARKDVPIVRILDRPSLPTVKSSPRRSLIVAMCGTAAAVIVLLAVIGGEAVRRRAEGPDGASIESLREDLSRSFPKLEQIVSKTREFVNS